MRHLVRLAAFSFLICATLTLGAAAVFTQPGAGQAEWLQWGGPTRNFVVENARLSAVWPADGPPETWRRPLGDGHSAILVDRGRVMTMYRPKPAGGAKWAAEEVVVSLDEETGRTAWEYRYPARPLDFQFGAGPYSTPLIVGDRVFVSGTNNQLIALDVRSGQPLWSHDLVKSFGARETVIRPAIKAGMSTSPLAYRNSVIVTAGGAGQSVMAFDQATGAVLWRGGDFDLSQASPILIDVDGEVQLVVSGGRTIHGMDPSTGRMLWSHPHDTDGDMNITTPLWTSGNLLFLSSAYNSGSRMLQLTRVDGTTRVSERWFSRALRIHFGTAVRTGDMMIGSSGDFGPAFITAIDVETGERLWQDRGFARATFLKAGDKLLILDEDGAIGLARATRAGLEVLARADVLTSRAWTVPTLVHANLYVRDRQTIRKLILPTDPAPR